MIIISTALKEDLRIWDLLEEAGIGYIVDQVDFTLLGLTSLPSVYGAGGIKNHHNYLNEAGELVVSKNFSYNDLGTTITFEWYDVHGEVGLSKEVFKPMSPVQLASLARKNRERTLMYLKSQADGTPIESSMAELLLHFKPLIDLWLMNSSSEWLEAVQDAPEGTIRTILDVIATSPMPELGYPDGMTIGEGIIYQITNGVGV